MQSERFPNLNLNVAVEKCCFLGFWCEPRLLCVQSLLQPDLDDQIIDYLITSMAAVQDEDERASFLCVGDLNGHHQE